MNAAAKRRQGQPLVVFLLLLLGWTGFRVAVWESPMPQISPISFVARPPQLQRLSGRKSAAKIARPHGARQRRILANQIYAPVSAVKRFTADVRAYAPSPVAANSGDPPEVLPSAERVRPVESGAEGSPQSQPYPQHAVPKPGTRWSLYNWLFLRPDAGLAANAGPQIATYGASQVGAVLRYRLQQSSRFREAAYLRASKTLAADREAEIAAGLSAVPFRGIPVAMHAELRATRGGLSTELRPAAFAVTETPPVTLPLGLQGVTYLAAGYVGGDFATAFVDGQARVDGEVLNFSRSNVRVGAGTWGGAQKGAARLDIGPSASVDLQLGAVPARIAVDYRLRVAGTAEPRSGAAITLSTGF